jgi:hypothetical protein
MNVFVLDRYTHCTLVITLFLLCSYACAWCWFYGHAETCSPSFDQRNRSSENILVMVRLFTIRCLILLTATWHRFWLPGEAGCWEHLGVEPPCCGDTSCRVWAGEDPGWNWLGACPCLPLRELRRGSAVRRSDRWRCHPSQSTTGVLLY